MGRVAWIFPGQGCQQVGMCVDFDAQSRASREVFARANAALGFDLSGLIATGPAEKLSLTEHTQPAVLVASMAAFEAAREAKLPAPDFVAGHSLGEWTALVAAGALSLEDAVRTVQARGRFMQEAVPVGEGAMSAVLKLPPHTVEEACREVRDELPGQWVGPSSFNGPEQTVISGHAQAVAVAGDRCKAKGARRVTSLGVSAPFHSPLMEPVTSRLAETLTQFELRNASVPVVTNVSTTPETDASTLRRLLLEQVTAPVRWTEVVERLGADGVDVFLELGPGSTLSGMVKRQLPDATVFALSNPSQVETARLALCT